MSIENTGEVSQNIRKYPKIPMEVFIGDEEVMMFKDERYRRLVEKSDEMILKKVNRLIIEVEESRQIVEKEYEDIEFEPIQDIDYKEVGGFDGEEVFYKLVDFGGRCTWAGIEMGMQFAWIGIQIVFVVLPVGFFKGLMALLEGGHGGHERRTCFYDDIEEDCGCGDRTRVDVDINVKGKADINVRVNVNDKKRRR